MSITKDAQSSDIDTHQSDMVIPPEQLLPGQLLGGSCPDRNE